ncbi:hypothetical protein AB0B56_31740 [Streptosporangium canum]
MVEQLLRAAQERARAAITGTAGGLSALIGFSGQDSVDGAVGGVAHGQRLGAGGFQPFGVVFA